MKYKTNLEKREKAIKNAIKETYGQNAIIQPDPEYAGILTNKGILNIYDFIMLDVYSRGIKTNKTNITIHNNGKIILKSKTILKNSKINSLKKAIEKKSFICDIV
ncbi:hypothetical protein K9L67_00380 [Candidatus Woesearchaeota archaeon]|nr:hypothetical protein [Candidatus Woesearchaeota archaeon]MCF7900662.1 hypothetical protein [Candidatus Woesearchaeota archaeon]MCF8013503.1 hypothetical protein [Candidatus Woesearchaeota archaeon]